MKKENEGAPARVQIDLSTSQRVEKFLRAMNSAHLSDEYRLEDASGEKSADAKSALGASYAGGEFQGKIYLVNYTNDGVFPSFIDEFIK